MTKSNYDDGVKLYAFDLDGTVYVGDRLIDGAKEALGRLRTHAEVCYLTNNSSKTKDEYLYKLRKLGIEVTEREMISSMDATVSYVKAHHPGKSAYIVGTERVVAEACENGIVFDDKHPDMVIVTLDTELTYEKLCKLCSFVQSGALYLATHPDCSCPAPGGFVPDVGSFLSLVETATGRRPNVICGKPYRPMAEELERRFGCFGSEVMMVGDRLSTDIRFGIDCGYRTCAVLTGATTPGILAESGMHPTVVLGSIAEMK